jgi:Ferritin-like
VNAPVRDRFQLLTLLSEACELEHGLACCYLYAAVSLKQDLSEGRLSWQQLQKVRLWASQVFHVAAEEMLHLAQAWNLLTAIGGTPWYGRPNFPQSSSYYPLHLPLETKPFSLETLERFIAFEHPHDPAASPLPAEPGDDAPAFRSVGELYALIAEGMSTIPEHELFIGNPDHQVGPQLIDFPNLTSVVDRASALQAIETITEQGEGTPGDRDDSHFDIFRRTRRSLLEQTLAAEESGETFEPVRPCIANPVAFAHPFLGAPGANELTDAETALVADAFDSIYQLMLRLLQYVFDSATSDDADALRPFASAALELMTTVIKPLAEALTLMPAGQRTYGAATAGPTFATGRNVPLPLTPALAQRITEEKLAQLRERLDELAAPGRPAQLHAAARNLKHIKLQEVPLVSTSQ